jgi:AcrR family transcriptional regulator
MVLSSLADGSPAPPPAPAAIGAVSPDERICDAALRCIARWGLAKTTLDDIAREAGCSRATVYRTFPGGKDVVVEAVARQEIARFFDTLDAELSDAGDLETLLTRALMAGHREIRGHEALQFLLAHEPGLVLPLVAFQRLELVLAAAVAFGAPRLAPYVGELEASRAAEWVARLVVSYAMCPSESYDLTDEVAVRRLVRHYLVPGLTRAAPSVS